MKYSQFNADYLIALMSNLRREREDIEYELYVSEGNEKTFKLLHRLRDIPVEIYILEKEFDEMIAAEKARRRMHPIRRLFTR